MKGFLGVFSHQCYYPTNKILVTGNFNFPISVTELLWKVI